MLQSQLFLAWPVFSLGPAGLLTWTFGATFDLMSDVCRPGS